MKNEVHLKFTEVWSSWREIYQAIKKQWQQVHFNTTGWFRKASQRAMHVMKSFVTCSTSFESDDNFSEYLARVLGEPSTTFLQDNRDLSLSACSNVRDASLSFISDDSFSQYFANVLGDPGLLCLQGGEDQTPSIGHVPLKASPSSKVDDKFAEYLTSAVRKHYTSKFRDEQDETLPKCSIPQDAACSSSKSDVNHIFGQVGSIKSSVGSQGRNPSTYSTPRETTPKSCATPSDVWLNKNGGKPPIGCVGKLDANTSSHLAAICMSEKSQIFERPQHIIEGSESVISSTYVKMDQCQCIEENMVSNVFSAQPKLPADFFNLPPRRRLRAAKQFLSEFEYRLNSHSNFQVKKQRPLSGLMATAKLIIHQPEPIKCVEAVFIALYLTAGLQSVERIPLGFQTQFANQVFHHIVLLVRHKGKYGAFGISRSPDLMTKDLCYDSMSSIIEDFKTAYEESDHTILKLQVGLPVEHNIMSSTFVCWEHLCVCPTEQPWEECVAAIENHALRMEHLWNIWVISGRGADPTRKPFKSLRKAPVNSASNTRAKPTKNETSTLQKRPHQRKQFGNNDLPKSRSTNNFYTSSYQSTSINKNRSQDSHVERNAQVPSISIMSLLKESTSSGDGTSPRRCPKHGDQGTTCSSLNENEEHVVIHASEPNPWEVCKFCDCGNPLCRADYKLPAENSESLKSRESGALYNLVLKRAGAKSSTR